MFNDFIKYNKDNSLIEKDDHVLVAVSGGMDSVVLLDLLSRSDYKYSIAHCNFLLRGNESDDDEAFVKELANKYRAKVYINRCDAADYANRKKLSIQESARELRYQWFEKLCKEHNFQKVAIAHHNDDQIETFFINLLRGAGLAGLKGMPLQRDNVIRPLLFARRKDIEDYVNLNNLEFREDSSNESDKYLRNNIRHNLIPVLSDISSNAVTSITKSIDNLFDANELVTAVIDQKSAELTNIDRNGIISYRIDDLIKNVPFEIWMYYMLSKYGFSRIMTDEICSSLLLENNTGKVYESSDYELLIDRDRVLIREKKFASTLQIHDITTDTKSIEIPIKIKFELVTNTNDFRFKNDPNVSYFDFNKIKYPLTIRPWKKGDRMVPYGMKGSKLISDILINSKVDLFTKESTYVILSDDEIVWLVGYRSSDSYKVTKKTTKILVATFVK